MIFATKHFAFTLVELLLVVVLLSVIAGLTVPNFSRTYAHMQLEKTADDLAFLMRYAQSRAVIKRRKVRIEFDSSLSTYWLAQESGESQMDHDAERKMFKRFSGRLGRDYHIPDIFTVETDQEKIYFYPDGTIDKQHIKVCREEQCKTISTREQRGYVRVLNNRE